jgi:hypothetical protein
MSAGVAEHPAAAAQVEDDRQGSPGTLGFDDPHAGIADRGRDGDPLLVDRQLLGRTRLDVVQELARRRVVQVAEERRPRRSVRELLRGGLKKHRGL